VPPCNGPNCLDLSVRRSKLKVELASGPTPLSHWGNGMVQHVLVRRHFPARTRQIGRAKVAPLQLGADPADNALKRYLRAGLQRIRPAAASCFQNKGGHS
jgi:hypothetical protein